MFPLLLLAFLSIPFIELYLLISVGRVIGAPATLLSVLLISLIGAFVVKVQGRKVMHEMQRSLQAGQLPADQLLQGFMIFVGGLLLVTPGFFTDFIGLLLLFPLSRWALLKFVKAFLIAQMKRGTMVVMTRGAWPGTRSGPRSAPQSQSQSQTEPLRGPSGPSAREVIDIEPVASQKSNPSEER